MSPRELLSSYKISYRAYVERETCVETVTKYSLQDGNRDGHSFVIQVGTQAM